MKKPKISVIIPVFNSEKTISQCVDACLRIIGYPLEIILIDDGSTDNSLEICNRYHNKYANVIVFHQTNAGVSSARNKGLELSSGEILYFIDSDDIPCVEAIMASLRKMEDSKADIFLGGFAVTDIDGTVVKKFTNMSLGLLEPEETCIKFIHNQISVCVGSFFVKKKCVSGVSFLNGIRYGEDTTYIVECIVQCSTVYVDEVILVLYRQNEMSVMHRLDLSRFDNYFARMELYRFLRSGHIEMRLLIQTVEEYYIPQVIDDDIRLLCHYGFSLKRIKSFLRANLIDKEIEKIISKVPADPDLKDRLSLWVDMPLRYYCLERSKRVVYLIRSSASRFKHWFKGLLSLCFGKGSK